MKEASVAQQMFPRRLMAMSWRLLAVAGVLLCVVCAQPAAAQTINGRAPLMDAAALLQQIFARPVSYEMPQPLWEGAVDLSKPRADGSRSAMPKEHSLVLPAGINSTEEPDLTLAMVQKVVDAYNQQNPDQPRFGVLESRLGFHIVPWQVHDASGKLVPATNPLDTVISVPKARRTASEHVSALLAAVTAASGAPMVLSDMWFDQYYAANSYLLPQLLSDAHRPYMLFEWGVEGVSARDAVISLMDGSSTTMSFRLSCGGMGWQKKGCFFSMMPLMIGTPTRAVQYDRCTNCQQAPVPPVDVRSLPGWTPLR
jgi:hypothetical protein